MTGHAERGPSYAVAVVDITGLDATVWAARREGVTRAPASDGKLSCRVALFGEVRRACPDLGWPPPVLPRKRLL